MQTTAHLEQRCVRTMPGEAFVQNRGKQIGQVPPAPSLVKRAERPLALDGDFREFGKRLDSFLGQVSTRPSAPPSERPRRKSVLPLEDVLSAK